MLQCHVHCGASDAAKRASDEHRPARLWFYRALDELSAGREHQRQSGGLLEAKAVRNRRKDVRLHCCELGVSSIGESHHALAFAESSHFVSKVRHLACEVAAQDRREVDGHALAGRPAADLPIDRVNAGGPNPHADLGRAKGRFPLIVFKAKLVDVAVFVKNNRFHRIVSSPVGMARSGGGSLAGID